MALPAPFELGYARIDFGERGIITPA